MIVDDHPITRLGLRTLLAGMPELEIAGEAHSLAEARRWFLDENAPELVVADLKLGDGSGLELVREHSHHARFVVVTMFASAEVERDARAAGAHGFANKETASVHLANIVRCALAGLGVRGQPMLSPRECEVLVLVAEGLTNAAIGARLAIGMTTVRTHVVHILEKLGARDRTEAAVLAVRAGLVPRAPR